MMKRWMNAKRNSFNHAWVTIRRRRVFGEARGLGGLVGYFGWRLIVGRAVWSISGCEGGEDIELLG